MNKISKYIKRTVVLSLVSCAASPMLTSCTDALLDTGSEIVEFQEDHKLNNLTDSIYSTLGIISKLQVIADRTVLLGEMRGDLTTVTDYANADLKAIANFDVKEGNRYNQISDYYAVINNCNYFIAYADTTLSKRGYKIFESEYASAKAFRAWTYLQAALVYGNVPLITEPILTEKDAEEAINKNVKSLEEICEYFINDVKPYVETQYPNLSSFASDYESYFIPVRLLLADLYLWKASCTNSQADYVMAAQYYHDYLTNPNHEIPTGVDAVKWADDDKYASMVPNKNTLVTTSSEYIWIVRMEENEFDGVRSELDDIFSSNLRNDYYAQAKPSEALYALSSSEGMRYTQHYDKNKDGKPDTAYVNKDEVQQLIWKGDLRLQNSYYDYKSNEPVGSRYSSKRQTIDKFWSDRVAMERRTIVYLHFAEALNRAGLPESAFAVLKYGLLNTTTKPVISKYISQEEREYAYTLGSGTLLSFSINRFNENNTQGIHARGCGAVEYDSLYVIKELPTKADTIQYVEDKIIEELALETAYEGRRYYDLMRVAIRRNDPAYLAEPVSKRNGTQNAAIYNLLMDKENWYLKK